MLTKLPQDFSEFLKLLNANRVEYLVIGGYAVAHYGYPRPTADFDVWVAIGTDNIARTITAITEFGFADAALTPDVLMVPGRIIRMGVPPMRLEVMNAIDGVEFTECYARRNAVELDGTLVNMISLADLKKNKSSTGRNKDKSDLDYLP